MNHALEAIYAQQGLELGSAYTFFLQITGGYDRFVESYALDLDAFYLTSLRRLFSTPEGRRYVTGYLEYDGQDSTDSRMAFVKGRLARTSVPRIELRIKSLKENSNEY